MILIHVYGKLFLSQMVQKSLCDGL